MSWTKWAAILDLEPNNPAESELPPENDQPGRSAERLDFSDNRQRPSDSVFDKQNSERPNSIRNGRAEDAEAVRALVKQHHERTIFGHLPVSERKLDQYASTILTFPPHMATLVAERDGQIVGFLWATAGTYALSDEGVMATCHLIAIDIDTLHPVARARVFLSLLKALKAWSKTRGAERILVHVTTGETDKRQGTEPGFSLKATHRLLEKVGAEAIGGGYVL